MATQSLHGIAILFHFYFIIGFTIGDMGPACRFMGKSQSCVVETWLNSGCTEEGTKHPKKLADVERDALLALNFSTLQAKFRELVQRTNASKAARVECHGEDYPVGCTSALPPVQEECLIKLFTDAGCVIEGSMYPTRISVTHQKAISELNLMEWRSIFHFLKYYAERGDKVKQTLCYGMEFPPGCSRYEKVLSEQCLIGIFEKQGCQKEGSGYPTKLTKVQKDVFAKKNLKEVIEQIDTLITSAHGGVEADQLNCYGLKFPKLCKKFASPLSLACLNGGWEEAGCKPEGAEYPRKLGAPKIAALYGMNLREYVEYVETKFNATALGSVDEQIACYGFKFATGCSTFYGPNAKECLNNIFVAATCKAEGTGYPSKLPVAEFQVLRTQTLKQLAATFQAIKDQADAGSSASQEECFGSTHFQNCPKFNAPLSMRCLTSIWIYEVGCTANGRGYPQNLVGTDFNKTYGTKNQREAYRFMKKIKDAKDVTNQTLCLGTFACPTLFDCDKQCQGKYVLDSDGCRTCQCQRSRCRNVTNCHKQCPFGYKHIRKDCYRCKCNGCPSLETCDRKCNYGFIINNYGCRICKCKDELSHAVITFKNWPVQTCVDGITGDHHDDGESWNIGCRLCVCRHGDILCGAVKCPSIECLFPIKEKEDSCCLTCPNNASANVPATHLLCETPKGNFVEGDTWEKDHCTSCMCHNGHVVCVEKSCPGPTAQFHSCTVDGKTRQHHEHWNVTDDKCSACICMNGKAECHPPVCEPVSSSCRLIHRPPDACCDRCVLEDNDPRYKTIKAASKEGKDVLSMVVGLGLSVVATSLLIHSAVRQLTL